MASLGPIGRGRCERCLAHGVKLNRGGICDSCVAMSVPPEPRPRLQVDVADLEKLARLAGIELRPDDAHEPELLAVTKTAALTPGAGAPWPPPDPCPGAFYVSPDGTVHSGHDLADAAARSRRWAPWRRWWSRVRKPLAAVLVATFGVTTWMAIPAREPQPEPSMTVVASESAPFRIDDATGMAVLALSSSGTLTANGVVAAPVWSSTPVANGGAGTTTLTGHLVANNGTSLASGVTSGIVFEGATADAGEVTLGDAMANRQAPYSTSIFAAAGGWSVRTHDGQSDVIDANGTVVFTIDADGVIHEAKGKRRR